MSTPSENVFNATHIIQHYRPIRIDKGSAVARFEFANPHGRPLSCKLMGVNAFPAMKGKKPLKGESKYDYDNATTIYLNHQECFKLASLLDLFLGGRFPAFAKAADKRSTAIKSFSRHIIHDPTLNPGYRGPKVKKIVELDHKDQFSLFFRIKTRESGQNGKDLQVTTLVLDYWDIKMLAVMLSEFGRTLLGFNQMNASPKYDTDGGNITEQHRPSRQPPRTDARQEGEGDIPLDTSPPQQAANG